MKKLLAMLLALVLALSCTLSLAEAADAPVLPTISMTGTYAVDREVLAAALSAFGVDESVAAIADTVAAVLNELGERLIVADNGAEIALSLKGKDLITLVGELTDDGVSLGSSLIPTHVLTLSGETLAKALQSAAGQTESALSGLDFAALGEAVGSHAETFANSCVSAVTYGEPVPGDYVMDGISYNVMVPINVDLEAIINALNTFMDAVSADENVQAALKQLEDKGFKLSAGEDNKPLSDESLPRLDFEAYMTMDEEGNATGATDVAFKVYAPESEEVATMGDVLVEDEHVRVTVQFFDTVDADATPVNVLYEINPIDDGQQHRMELYVNDMFFALACSVAVKDAVTIDSEVYVLDNEKPLLRENVVLTQDGQRTVALNDGGKQVVAIEDLIDGEKADSLRSALIMEAMISGIGGIVANASEAMPEEVSTLMSLFMGSGDEAPAA